MQDVIDRTQQMGKELMLKVLHENLELGLYTSGLDLSSKTILWFNTLWNIAARLEIRSLVSLVRSMSPVS